MVVAVSEKPVVIYDGECPFCIDQIKRIRSWDRDSCFEYVARQTPGIDARFPVLQSVDFNKGMRLIEPEGQMFAGADALYHIFRRLPATNGIAWLYNVPGITQIARAVYAWIAANRKSLGKTCETGACDIDTAKS